MNSTVSSSPKLGLLIQARMTSKRLPSKAFLKIGPRSILGHCCDRAWDTISLLKAGGTEVFPQPIVATTTNFEDGPIEAWCKEEGIECYRGADADVLTRIIDCAGHFGIVHIARICGDSPFFDPQQLVSLIHLRNEEIAELVTDDNLEVVHVAALKTVDREIAGSPLEHLYREHVTMYMKGDRPGYRVIDVRDNIPRLTIDTQEDYDEACQSWPHNSLSLPTRRKAVSYSNGMNASST